jgi:hypothetical protein
MSDTRFIIPGFRSTPEERRAAIARMNTITLTIEQFEQGWDLYERTQLRCMRGELPREAPMAALEDFCAGADLLPADLAAAAIYVRADPIVDARSGAFDMKMDDPDNYASCILDPLDDNALDYPALDVDELQEELALED